MKIAYLAPELPALSATFVYNEILQLEQLGDSVLPFSVRRPHSIVENSELDGLKKNVVFIYEQKKHRVVLNHIKLLCTRPVLYLKSASLLIKDVFSLGVVSRNAFGVLYRFFYAASVADKLIVKDCRHLHAHFAHVPSDIAMYAAKMAGISFSLTAHANDIFERGWLLKEKANRSAFFATISQFNKNYLTDLGVANEKIHIVRCGVNFEAFSQRRNRIPNQTLKIGVVGRLVEKKGIDTLIRVAAKLKQQGIRFELCIAGSGPLESALRLLARELELSSVEVQFLGAMPHDKVSDFIKSLDIFALPCQRDINGDMDGIPVALMEAMLAGVPVISTYISGIPELVVNKETGLLVQPNDVKGLTEAITTIIQDENLTKNLINNAHKKVKSEFSLLNNTQKLFSLFHS